MGIFSEVGGWIAYSNGREGIFAVDPTQPGDPNDQIRLSENTGTPVAWSPDGSKLLILRNAPNQDPDPSTEQDLKEGRCHSFPAEGAPREMPVVSSFN
jgi:hypothetical protein